LSDAYANPLRRVGVRQHFRRNASKQLGSDNKTLGQQEPFEDLRQILEQI
jgi:hypothetical protein